MKLAFFVSSAGDTDLAKATITTLMQQSHDQIFLIPLTTTAVDRINDLRSKDNIRTISIDEIVGQAGLLAQDTLTIEQSETVKLFLENNNVQHVYLGVPSSNNEMPYQIAKRLTMPFTLAYEYMFKPEKHALWKYADELAQMPNSHFAVPLDSAVSDMPIHDRETKIHVVGHLSLDRTSESATDVAKTRGKLSVNPDQDFVFISGTTQPSEIDNQFLNALLFELATGKHSGIQLRMGIHPGVKNLDAYLSMLLETCERYPQTVSQFKIILTTEMANKLQEVKADSRFIIRADVTGSEAAQAADKVAQAVPGALLNEAALKGKPSYFHDETAKPYLPKTWFSTSIPTFFATKPVAPRTKNQLGLADNASATLSKLLTQA